MAQTEAHQAKSIKILAERRKEKRRKNLQESCPLWGHSLAEKKIEKYIFFLFSCFSCLSFMFILHHNQTNEFLSANKQDII